MKNKGNTQIDEIIGSLDNIQRATAPDFFYTRLKARMEKEMIAEPRKSWALSPVYILGVLFIVLAVNAAVLLKGSSTETTVSDTETMQSIASEYRINSNLTYEINQ